MKPRVFLAAVGDANSPVTWSGIPYYFLQAGKARGLIDEGLPLFADGWPWRVHRIAWNLKSLFSGDRIGGYQYSVDFLERLWAPVCAQIENGVVINCFQLFAPSVIANQTIKKWFFIDQTLRQLFDHYGLRSTVGRRIALQAIERERQGYQAAVGIIAHSNWAARSLIDDYGVAPGRIHVVVPGANLDPDEYALWENSESKQHPIGGSDHDGSLRLVFVGKEWQRKGLDRLLRGLQLARRSGASVRLRVIGCPQETVPVELRNIDGVEWFGFIDKRREAGRFLRAVSECDVGCLLSRAEAGGMAIREYHALGLPVVGTDAGGAPEHMIMEAAIVISAQASDESISETLSAIAQNVGVLEQLRWSASEARRSALWSHSVATILEFWPHGHGGQGHHKGSSRSAPLLAQVSVG